MTFFAIRAIFTPGKPQPPERNPKFLKWLLRFPCFACGESRKPREAMHMGAHGIGTKAPDMDALPGCRACHREYHASARRFYGKIGYDHVANMQAYFRALWKQEQDKYGSPCAPVGDPDGSIGAGQKREAA